MVVQTIQNLVWILPSGESVDPLKPFEWIWMVVQLATNTVQMVSPCVYKTNGHFWKWKFWILKTYGCRDILPALFTACQARHCEMLSVWWWYYWKPITINKESITVTWFCLSQFLCRYPLVWTSTIRLSGIIFKYGPELRKDYQWYFFSPKKEICFAAILKL